MTDQQAEIKRLYLLGCQNKSIAKLMGLTINQTTRIIYKELELQSKNKKLTTKEISEAKRLYQEGLKRREIRDRMGIDRNRLNHILKGEAA